MLLQLRSIFACFRVISSVFPGNQKKGTSALMNGIRGRAQHFSGRRIYCNPVGPTTSESVTNVGPSDVSKGVFKREEGVLAIRPGVMR